MDYRGQDELYAMERGAPRYNEFLIRTFFNSLPFIPTKETKILDFGAGIGTLSFIWQEKFVGNVHCLEPDTNQAKIVIRRGLKCFTKISEVSEKYDCVYSSNVLEHIDQDVETLKGIHSELLDDGGVLIIFVPAFQFLYSPVDKKLGHFRRYSKRELISKVSESNFGIVRCEYVDSLGFLASMVVKILGVGTNVANSSGVLFLYDKVVFPLSRLIDKLGTNKVFGKNLLLVARKMPT